MSPIHENFLHCIAAGNFPAATVATESRDVGLNNADLLDLFESQLMSRHVDLAARRLKAKGQGFYTIGSAGHEGNAVFGKVFRTTDMAFLHYRSGAFLIQRAKHVPNQQPVRDILLSIVASSDDPVSGGRHKVLGNAATLVPPQTSIIASHLPKAMGAACAIDLAATLKTQGAVMPPDAVIVCTFGDASANHSTALGAINAAALAAYQNLPMPIVFICEDNGLGISVHTPPGWIQKNFSGRPGLHYLHCDGLDLVDCWRGAVAATEHARRNRAPVFLHARMVRLMGHAGEDHESEYRTPDTIQADENNDPLLHSARRLVEAGILTTEQILELYRRVDGEVTALADEVITHPKLATRAEVLSALLPPRMNLPAPLPVSGPHSEQKPQPMARHINQALADLMQQYPEIVLCGQDIARKGGVYGITKGLLKKFGAARVMDTILDEQSILGLALGLAHNNLLAIPEIQFLAYLHNALDQIRGEAATLSFFSRGAFRNPTLVRLPGLAYQKGFGGHFHNDNSLTALRDIPGVVVACPSNGRDAARMLRTCVCLAREQGRVVLFVEPIALYYTRDLHVPGDGLWAAAYQAEAKDEELPFGQIGIYGEGTDLCILTYGNGTYLSRQAEKELREQHGMQIRITDLRWLSPLPEQDILRAVSQCKRILIVDEGRRSGSISEALCTLLLDAGITTPVIRLTGEDCFIPLGDAARLVLPSKDGIITAALQS